MDGLSCLLQRIARLRVGVRIASTDPMFRPEWRDHYFHVGKSAILSILNALNLRLAQPGGDAALHAILVVDCSYGRVARWIRAAFPDADIYVDDANDDAVNWCVEQYECKPFREGWQGKTFDLIWLDSALSHLSETAAEKLLQKVMESISPGGILLFATQGRYSAALLKNTDPDSNQPWRHYYLDGDQIKQVVRAYVTNGYGYVDSNLAGDSVCIAKPQWYADRILAREDFVQILFEEKGYDNHQDVSAFMRIGLLDDRRGPLWQLGFRSGISKRRGRVARSGDVSPTSSDHASRAVPSAEAPPEESVELLSSGTMASRAARLAQADIARQSQRPFTLGTRPVIRWIKGDGLDDQITRSAIALATRLFGAEVDYCLCTAGLSPARARAVLAWADQPVEWWPVGPEDNPGLAAVLMAAGCDPDRFGYWWKWFPERVRAAAPEWRLDGDMVITGRPRWFDLWCKGIDKLRVTQDDAWDINHMYGDYLNLVDHAQRLYSGLISLPPGAGYMEEVFKVVRRQPLIPRHDGRVSMSEGGVMACAFGALDPIPIPLNEFPFARAFEESLSLGTKGEQDEPWGYHFGGSFRRENPHFHRMESEGQVFWRQGEGEPEERFAWLRNWGQWGTPGWSMHPYFIRRIADLARSYAGRGVLEIGSSRGQLSAIMASCGCYVTTVDAIDRGARENLEGMSVKVVVSDGADFLRGRPEPFSLIVVDLNDNSPRVWQELWPLLSEAVTSDGTLVVYNTHLWRITEWQEETGLRWISESPPSGWDVELFPEPLPGMAICRRA